MDYVATIGLEVHIQIKTKTKMFCACPNRYGDEPNALVCPICLGYPGVMPVPNGKAIKSTIIAGLMCDCTISEFSKFDRKSYFYPDMPKNYQITQYDLPFCLDGYLKICGQGFSGKSIHPKKIRINRIHLEEDVGKSIHYETCSGIDFNRAGVPLMEIVSEPDISTADEAYSYLSELKQIMQYADLSDCDMEKGQMRCDVNVSIRPKEQTELNPKTELKNLNSFKAAHKGIGFEIVRQTDLLKNHELPRQETRGWNDDLGESYLLRTKESDQDYRYFPEPDLTPIITLTEELDEIKKNLPETPSQLKSRFLNDYELPEYDASVLTSSKDYAAYFETCIRAGGNPKKISNWIMVELLRELSDTGQEISKCPISPSNFVELVSLIESKTINGKIAKTVFKQMFKTSKTPTQIIKEEKIQQITDSGEILALVQEIISKHPGPVEQFKEGKKAALNFLVGQVMKASKGTVDPVRAGEILKETIP